MKFNLLRLAENFFDGKNRQSWPGRKINSTFTFVQHGIKFFIYLFFHKNTIHFKCSECFPALWRPHQAPSNILVIWKNNTKVCVYVPNYTEVILYVHWRHWLSNNINLEMTKKPKKVSEVFKISDYNLHSSENIIHNFQFKKI